MFQSPLRTAFCKLNLIWMFPWGPRIWKFMKRKVNPFDSNGFRDIFFFWLQHLQFLPYYYTEKSTMYRKEWFIFLGPKEWQRFVLYTPSSCFVQISLVHFSFGHFFKTFPKSLVQANFSLFGCINPSVVCKLAMMSLIILEVRDWLGEKFGGKIEQKLEEVVINFFKNKFPLP